MSIVKVYFYSCLLYVHAIRTFKKDKYIYRVFIR